MELLTEIYNIICIYIYIYIQYYIYADMKLAGRGMLVPPWMKEPTATDLFEPLMQE